jgi:hypothetical protein
MEGVRKLFRMQPSFSWDQLIILNIQNPLASPASIKSDLKLPINRCNGASAAVHAICYFGKTHVSVAQQNDNSVEFAF